jgi:hypothetical protein
VSCRVQGLIDAIWTKAAGNADTCSGKDLQKVFKLPYKFEWVSDHFSTIKNDLDGIITKDEFKQSFKAGITIKFPSEEY